MKSDQIDTIIFDVGGVLCQFPWQAQARKLGLSEPVIYELETNPTFKKLWAQYDLANVPYEELHETYIRVLPEYVEELRLFIDNVDKCFRAFDYTLSLIRSLKNEGYHLFVLSNLTPFLYEGAMQRGDFEFVKYLDGAFFSYQINLMKPDPVFYKKLVEEYRIDPERTVYIDDVFQNTVPAETLGMKTILFKGYDKLIEEFSKLEIFAINLSC